MIGIGESSAMARTAVSAQLSPDELKKLAERQIAEAERIESEPERLRILTVADAMINLAEIKKLLLEYERRLLHCPRLPRAPADGAAAAPGDDACRLLLRRLARYISGGFTPSTSKAKGLTGP